MIEKREIEREREREKERKSGRSEVNELLSYFKRLEVERDDDMKRAGVKVC